MVASAVFFVVTRWRKDSFFGMVGIWIIVLPAIFGYFDGRVPLWEAIEAPIGILLIAADMREKLPGRSRIRNKMRIREPHEPH
jgi:hypothetical protein